MLFNRLEELTCMFCFPNSLFRLWLKARFANFPAAKTLVTTLPLQLAVAPVKSSVPLFPRSFNGFSWNARMIWRENANGAMKLASAESCTSCSVTSRKPFHAPNAAFHKATRISAFSGDGHWYLRMLSTTLMTALYE